ncbi:MAG: hypothetical protein M1331_01070 [Candidatus Marsarchaeota archaeon]|nr:hypothetical protein [Candidatus Marsarchaeota archaeon]MCL5105975.1 hypothetical protein [Candidatus Marsarchaeota archaeon]
MNYSVIINKRLRYVKVYAILKKIGQKENFMTKLFTRLLVKDKQEKKF